ncbi:MAG: hypothetical protein B7Y07_03260 [Halothiobacillus sp. 24-54-40]|nr:MAG: hypothetical protein B7Y58_02765 [Halothiobacillus sp. 35-54-62]OYZ87708.1 MAG: hypothetical protein B7Y07_03260 [Halothiobacillus sp. 24-54-40]OZA81490.1 MAG: hypothetical protein B7X64_01215 [Halothiobacillus sp. 39-53-45]HQS02810.1 hypothetical protein [Halothiobacillus sp.]
MSKLGRSGVIGLRRRVLAGVLLLGLGAHEAIADASIAVIVGKGPPKILFTRTNLADIFLKHILVDDNQAALVPLNLSSTNPLRRAFSVSLFGEQPDDLQRYWTERYFHGISPPYTVHSQESMLRFVTSTAGAVGYVASCRVDDRVAVVMLLPVPAAFKESINQLCPQ